MLLLDPNLRYFSRKHIVSLHKFNEPADSQVIIDHSGKGNHLMNGATSGVDANDIVLDGLKGTFDGANSCREESYGGLLGTSAVSLVDGTAFFEDDGRSDWADHAGKFLVLTDSNGVKCAGWIRAQGTGETLGTEAMSDGDMESNIAVLNDDYVMGGTYTQSVEQAQSGNSSGKVLRTDAGYGDNYVMFRDTAQSVLVSGGYYQISLWGYRITGADSIPIYLYTMISGWVLVANISSVEDWENASFRWTSSAGFQMEVGVSNDQNEYFYFDNVTMKQILTPTANGCTIFDAKTGGDQNWEFIEGNFDSNHVVSYEILSEDSQKITNIFSFSTVIKSTFNADYQELMSRYVSAGEYKILEIEPTGKGRFTVGVDSGYISSVETSLADGEWHSIVGTSEGASSAIHIYIDGMYSASGTSGALESALCLFYIGARNGTTKFFNGDMAHSAVYGRTIPSLEVSRMQRILWADFKKRGLL